MIPSPPVARAIRLAANVTQGQVAEVVGVHVDTVRSWESGDHRPRGEAGARYAALLRQLAEVTGA